MALIYYGSVALTFTVRQKLYNKTLSGGLESDEGPGASRVQGVGVYDSCENDLSVI